MAFHISTMAAAGLGNAFSDVVGIGAGSVVERWAERLGLPDHGLSHAQLHSRQAIDL